MYYPFLRGRQFELIALRELAAENATQGVVTPIIEPVKESINNLNLAHSVLKDKNQPLYLIVNPSVGEYPGDSTYYLDYLNELNSPVFKPAFLYRNNAAYINEQIEAYNLSDCMLIGTNEIQVDDQDFTNLVTSNNVTHITIFDPDKNRELRRALKNTSKQFIRLDDLFEAEARNSDYLDIQSHRFSEEHKYYSEDGYSGFSDFTILPSHYIDGGSTPRAVVIHLTYLTTEGQIWIRHFTSNSNESIADVQGKFGEAAEKAVVFCRQYHLTNSAITELEDYYDRTHYPGLGTVKKISIKNHLLVVAAFLRTI